MPGYLEDPRGSPALRGPANPVQADWPTSTELFLGKPRSPLKEHRYRYRARCRCRSGLLLWNLTPYFEVGGREPGSGRYLSHLLDATSEEVALTTSGSLLCTLKNLINLNFSLG